MCMGGSLSIITLLFVHEKLRDFVVTVIKKFRFLNGCKCPLATFQFQKDFTVKGYKKLMILFISDTN